MEANKTVLQMKYARIVNLFAKETGLTLEDALSPHMNSSVRVLPTSIVVVMNIWLMS